MDTKQNLVVYFNINAVVFVWIKYNIVYHIYIRMSQTFLELKGLYKHMLSGSIIHNKQRPVTHLCGWNHIDLSIIIDVVINK